MTVKYPRGQQREAVLLSRTDHRMRVVMRGAEDTAEFVETSGRWATERGEPIDVEFAWQTHSRPKPPLLKDCICPAKLAEQLIERLFAPEREPMPKRLTASS